MNKNDGGPAFPVVASNLEYICASGMTLRDYFAAKAMQSLVNQRCYPVDINTGICAYRVADAMLKAREEE